MEFTGKKKFKVSTKSFESIEIYAVFEIDFDFPEVKKRIAEMSAFWADSPDASNPLREHLEYVLSVATSKIYHEQDRNWKLSDVESMDNYLWNYGDGFAYGEYVGIKLIDFHADEICSDIFEVKEMKE
ncbi:hypothetical protein [Pasteurella multocida]|uniref:hypothetical protein n=1 Tax=Pasteurella multocida TaxID=747 RepID=UPI002341CEEA|nr:hypothetical protein [Pasteurella multocida]MDC4238411.1 hypothetical protein [Pasteurella multocida]